MGLIYSVLKFVLIWFDCDRIERILDTSRPPRVLEENGKNYWFIDREDMEREILENKFLEHGEYNGNLYGTHLDSIRDVIKQGMNGTPNFDQYNLGAMSIISIFGWFA